MRCFQLKHLSRLAYRFGVHHLRMFSSQAILPSTASDKYDPLLAGHFRAWYHHSYRFTADVMDS
jgi:hypothetical protein